MRNRVVFLFVVALIVGMTQGWAQVSSSIAGVVQDTSGANVPGATVTVRSLETGAVRTAVTDESGGYRVLALPVGRYEIKVAKEGFKTAIKAGIDLVVGHESVVNLSLKVGQTRQEVTVTGGAAMVDTNTTPASGLVSEHQEKDLPLNGRRFANLINVNPATSNTTSTRSTTSTGGGQGNNFSMSGNREHFNP